jgi:hypothetical protein
VKYRRAERTLPPSLPHDPPRSTRYVPAAGPCGLSAGDVL